MSDVSMLRSAPGEMTAVAALGDIPPGWVLKTRLGSGEIAVANCDGTIYAYDNSCPHAGGPLGDNRLKDGCYLECPWHNSVFDVTTGAPVSGAARKPIKRYQVKVEQGMVYVGAPLPAAPAGPAD